MTIKYLDSKRLSGSPISDIVQDTASISASSGAGSSLSHNITVANNSNRVLIACISTYGTKPSITGVTWNGSESMTAVPNSEAVDTNNRTQIYYLVNPTSGAHAINATFSASASSSGVAGISLYNVNQTTPVSAGNTNTGNVNNITVNITPTNVGSWIIGHLSSSSGIGSVSNLTEIYSVSAGALIRGGKNTSPVIGSANAIGWGTSSHTWALSGCEILRYGDIKPTNVQDNSIFVEKDTAKRFWFSEALAPTYGGNDITTDITWTQTIGSSTSDTFYILKDTGNDLMDIKAAGNCGTFANPSIGYATLGSTLSSSSWIVRFKLVFNTVTAESTGGKSFLTTFGVVDTATDWQDSENGFIFRFIADSGSAQTQFGSVTSGTVSTTSMSWTPATNNTIYVQIAYSSGTATANFYSDPEFLTGVGTANVTRSGTFSGIRYPQIAFLQDTGGNGVMEIDMKDLKIYNEATSITDATWTMNPTYESDFSTNAGWTNNGNTSVGQVNTTTKVLDAIGNVSTLCGVTRDLGAVDSTFLLRFKLGITVATQYTGGAIAGKVNIGLFSSDYDGRASQELIALDVNAFDNSYRFKAGGAITPDGGGDTGAGNYGVETRWVEIKRLASGDCKLTIFTDEYSTEEGSKTSTPSGTITSALRYLGVKSGNTGSGDGNNALTVDDIEFYNGVTSIN